MWKLPFESSPTPSGVSLNEHTTGVFNKANLNQNTTVSRTFKVEIHFWEDICERLSELGQAVADFIISGERNAEAKLEANRLPGDRLTSIVAYASDTSDITGLYSDINVLFDQRKLEAAEHEINKLPDPEVSSTLTTGERYGIFRLRAKLALEQQRFEDASRLFHMAYDVCPTLPQALQNRVLALELSESFDEAFKEASRLLREGIRTPLLTCLFIRNARTDVDLTEHRVIINDYCASQEDVNLALATKYLQWEQIAPASEAANRAASLSPDSAHAAFSQGMVAHQIGLHGEWHNRQDSFQKAVSFYSKAITAAERDKHFGLLPNIYVNRGRAQALRGDTDEAANDFRKAINLSNTPNLFAEDAVLYFLNIDDHTSALELAPLLDTTSKEGAFLSAVANYHNINGDEKQEYIRQFIKQANQDFDRATEVRFYCVQWAIEIKDFDLARQCVPQAFVDQMPFQGNTLLAYIAIENGNKELARTYANIVLESRGLNVRRNEIDFFATLLLRLRDDEKALPLLEQVATPGILDEACKRLITCAQRLERHDTLLRVCSELRLTNQHDKLTRKLEVQLLSKYSPQDAFNIATQFLHFEEPYFSAARNFLALRLGNPEAIEFDENNPPSAEDFDLEDAYLVITPLLKTRRFREAIVFSYYHLRKYFDKENAHVQFAALMLNYGSRAGATLPHPEVNRESAINLKNLTTGETRWLVIEDDSPELIRNEMSSTASTIQSLLGKQVNDVVHFRDTSVQDQKEEIIAIQSKYLVAVSKPS